MTRIIQLDHGQWDPGSEPATPLYSLSTMVLQSVGPMRHTVNVPFHDSQVKGKAVLIQTGWDARWGTDAYWERCPSLSDELIFRMVRSGVGIAGVDFWITREPRTQLVQDGKIPIVENLRDLSALPRWGFTFHVIPLPSGGVRAWAEVTS
jgi:kynurenine formamidase